MQREEFKLQGCQRSPQGQQMRSVLMMTLNNLLTLKTYANLKKKKNNEVDILISTKMYFWFIIYYNCKN